MENVKKVFRFLLERAKERSTWLGVITLLVTLGVNLSSEHQEAIINAGVAVASLILILSRENPTPPPIAK